MNTQKKLLVLLDGSERALDSVHYVASVRSFSSMTVVVLLNVSAQVPQSYLDLERKPGSPDDGTGISSWVAHQEKKRIEYMRRAEQILKESGISAVEIRVRKIVRGVARDILVEAKEQYSAVVLTRRGMGLLAGLPVGSVANKLLQKMSFSPIILAAPNVRSDRLLIAVDGSADSLRAVSFAVDMLGEGQHVGLIHVMRNMPGLDFMMTDADVEKAKAIIEDQFVTIREQLVQTGVRPEDVTSKIVEGSISRAGSILDEAIAGNYDTIVLGRKGLSEVSDFSMGRVSTKIVQLGETFAVWLI